jgi:hypothetical protein
MMAFRFILKDRKKPEKLFGGQRETVKTDSMTEKKDT